ncbi:ATP-binding cassette domain-containing protein [Glutamicibacter sp.]|uniref:ATP-binding cassette domain-containing protein n=1 Tax=Glutamicibacter sp. TaxID=1931995 RepID=UPI002B48CE84|nr:ATP-binding cassette domain-containing protein [Glutamicibacter sp.]HJX78313.1 ATP-binding cassette domain-containing protein [Glutamicibacter sp.]
MITLEALTKDYGATRAVNNLSVNITAGKVTGFLGPNGAGKSTTMRMILGLDAPTGGQSLVNGVPYAKLRYPLHTVGAHILGTAGNPGHTPRTFLKALAQSNQIPVRRVAEVLAEVGLQSVATKRIGGFSLGTRQRLGIAAALLGDPQILILDEPMNGLDAEGISWVRQLMRTRADAGGTIFVSSHLMSEVQQVADHLILIGRGELITEATTQELIQEFTQQLITVRTPRAAALAGLLTQRGAKVSTSGEGHLEVIGMPVERVGALAFAGGIELHELSIIHGSLENAYNQLTHDTVDYSAELTGGVRTK